MNDRSYLYDADAEQSGIREAEVDRIVECTLLNPAEVMNVVGGDEWEVLLTMVTKLYQPSQAGEEADHWFLRCYHDACGVINARVRTYARGQMES